jgi:hypothetical protein
VQLGATACKLANLTLHLRHHGSCRASLRSLLCLCCCFTDDSEFTPEVVPTLEFMLLTSQGAGTEASLWDLHVTADASAATQHAPSPCQVSEL